jgi:hypothetical protein
MFRTLWIATLVAAALAACKTRQADSPPSTPAPAPTRAAGAPTPAPALPDQPAEPPPAGAAGPASSAPGAPGTEVESRGIAAMQHLADALAADVKDCDKVAFDLRTFVADNKALIGELVAMQQRATTAPRSASANRVAAVAIGQSLQSALAACARNPGVAAAMQAFPAE